MNHLLIHSSLCSHYHQRNRAEDDADGVYYSDDKIIGPDKTDIADKNGLAVIDFKDHLNMKFSLAVESRHTKLRAFMYFEKYVFAKEHTFSFFKSTFE